MDKIRISTKKMVLTIEIPEAQADRYFDELCQKLRSVFQKDKLTSASVSHATVFNDPVCGWPAGKDDADQSGG